MDGPSSPVSGVPTPAGAAPGPLSAPPGQVSGPPAVHGSVDRDSDHSPASENGGGERAAVESGLGNPWDREFGGFGLGGRNSRFLFGGRNTAEPRPGLNGHGHGEVNGRSAGPDLPGAGHSELNGRSVGSDLPGTGHGEPNGRSTGSDLLGNGQPAGPDLPGTGHGEVNGRAASPGRPGADNGEGPGQREPRDENGRDDMNGRAGFSGVPTSGAGPAAPISGPGTGTDDRPSRRETGEPTGRRAAPGLGADDAVRTAFGAPEADAPTGRRTFGGDEEAAGRRSIPEDDPRRAAAGWASVPTSTHPIVGPTSAPPVSAPPSSGAPVSGAPISSAPASASPVSGGPVFGATFGQPPSYTPALPDPAAGPVSGVPAPRAAATIPVPVAKPQPQQADEKPSVSISFGDVPGDETDKRRSASLEDAEPVRRGRRAAPDGPEADDAPLRPGDVAAGHIAFWDDDAVRHFRAAWHEVKAEFVDDPETALTRAHDLLTDAVNELTEALLAERDELDPLRGTGTPDTESMRMAMRGYREFLDRILAL